MKEGRRDNGRERERGIMKDRKGGGMAKEAGGGGTGRRGGGEMKDHRTILLVV